MAAWTLNGLLAARVPFPGPASPSSAGIRFCRMAYLSHRPISRGLASYRALPPLAAGIGRHYFEPEGSSPEPPKRAGENSLLQIIGRDY